MSTDERFLEDFDPRFLQSIIKQGGKKKLDTLLEMFKSNGPARVAELQAAPSAEEAHAAARVLKNSAVTLGLMGLEAACDEVIASKAASPALAGAVAAKVKAALGLLESARKTL